MSSSTRSEFVDFISPLNYRLKYYDIHRSPTDQPKNDAADPARAIPQGFIDSMIIREEVFVKEQNVPLENELDEEDIKSFHWTAYASIPTKVTSPDLKPQDEKMDQKRRKSTSTKIPIGTIRLVPPPHAPHPGSNHESKMHGSTETYVKLGRLAVIKEFRKAGIAKLLIDTALQFVRNNPYQMLPPHDPTATEAQKSEFKAGIDFKGLVLVHSQTTVQKVWRKYGFETDESMGEWVEEGIQHVGMWKKLDVTEGRRKSKVLLPGHP